MNRLNRIPTLKGIADDAEYSMESFFDWLDTDTGKTLIANATNIWAAKEGVAPVYPMPTGGYAMPARAMDPTMLLIGAGLILVLMARK